MNTKKARLPIALSVTLAITIGIAPSVNSSPILTEKPGETIESMVHSTIAEQHTFSYIDLIPAGELEKYTKTGVMFHPILDKTNHPVAFSISHAQDDHGNDISSNFSVDNHTGTITIIKEIGEKSSPRFFFIEITGTYEDGSNHVDRLFVVSNNLPEASDNEGIPITTHPRANSPQLTKNTPHSMNTKCTKKTLTIKSLW